MPSMKFLVPVLVIIAALAGPVAAQPTPLPLANDGGRLVLDTLGQRVTLPRPEWLGADGTLADLATTFFFVDGDQASLRIFPRGEGEAFWSTVYGVRVSRSPAPVLKDFRALVIESYARGCRPETVALFQLEPDNGEDIPPLGFVCGAYRPEASVDPGKGEVMVVGFYKSATGMAMIYQEWRGAAFDAADQTTWPVSPQRLEQSFARLRADAGLARAD